MSPLYLERKLDGRCVYCGAPDRHKALACAACYAKQSEWRRSAKGRASELRRIRRWRAERRAKHVCVECHRKAKSGATLCREHLLLKKIKRDFGSVKAWREADRIEEMREMSWLAIARKLK